MLFRVGVTLSLSAALMWPGGVGSAFSQAATQGRGGMPGWKLAGSKPGEVRHLYWKEQNKTELWVHLKTERIGGGPNPTILVFFVTYAGTVLEGAPSVVHLHGESDMLVELRTPREQRLSLEWDNGKKMLDLVAPDRQFALNYPCGFGEQCWFDAVIADMSSAEFADVASSAEISGNALGFEFNVTPDDMEPLREFGRRINVLR